MARTLVIQLGRLGDVIQTTPLLAELSVAGDEIDVLVLRSAHEPLIGFSAVANVITIPDALKSLDDAIAYGFPLGQIPPEAHELLVELQLSLYDRVIHASHAPLGCWLASVAPCATPAARHGGVIRDRECLYLGPASVYRVAMLQFREQNLFNLVDLLRAIHGGMPPPRRPFLYANQSGELPFALPQGKRVALNPGASESARCWPAESFARLAEALFGAGFVPVLVGALPDRELCERIQSTAHAPVSNFAGRTTICEMAALLACCDLVVTADTGAAHLAAAVGATVLGLYGATAWFAETAPYGDNHLILQTTLDAPMSSISVEVAIAAALNRLGRLPVDELRRELRTQNQSAWEISVGSPSDEDDQLGGLFYRSIDRDALTPDELFARSLRHEFASEFVSVRNGVLGHADGYAVESLGQIFERMEMLAVICSESTQTRCGFADVSTAAHALITIMEKLRTMAAEPTWRGFSPIIHNLDWQLRMLPEQSPEETFRSHAEAYASAARVLRGAGTRKYGALSISSSLRDGGIKPGFLHCASRPAHRK